MSDLTLDQLLNSLQSGMNKQADAQDGDGEKEKDEKSDDKGEKKMPPWLKDKDEKSEDKKDKSDDKDEKEDEDGQEKKASASEAGAALAREIMEKVASLNLEKKTPEMNKQAQTAGQALASALLSNLQKRANAGDMTLMDGSSAPGTVPGKVQNDVAQAQSELTVQPMPTGNGVTNQGDINQIFDGIVQDALNQGAASTDQVHTQGVSEVEGDAEAQATPDQVKVASDRADDFEKAAAISELVQNGIDYDDAVALVKQAAEEIEFEIEKAAAMTQLMSEGVDFDEAIELVKQASAGDMVVMDGSSADGTVPNKVQNDVALADSEGASYIKPMPTSDGIASNGTINEIFDAIVQDAVSQGAAPADQSTSTGLTQFEGAVEDHAVPSQVKVAAINRMVEAGVDFEDAVDFIAKSASFAGMVTRARRVAQVAGTKAVRAVSEQAGKAKASMGSAAGNAGDTIAAKAREAMSSARAAGNTVKSVVEPGVGKAKGYGQAGMDYVANKTAPARESVSKSFNEAKDLTKTIINPENNKWGQGGPGVRGAAAKNLMRNGFAQSVAGGVGLAAAGGAGYAMGRGQEKKAAFDALIEAGVDFDQAAILVSQKAQELYGE